MARWPELDDFLKKRGIRYGAPTVGQTTGGTHVDGSYHYAGLARDYGDANSDVPAILAAFLPYAQGSDYTIAELFGLNVYWKNGKQFTPSADLRADHQDHAHVAVRPLSKPSLFDQVKSAAGDAAAIAGLTAVAGPAGAVLAGVQATGGSALDTLTGGAASAITGVKEAAVAAGKLATALTSGETWRRLGLILAGVAVLVLGLVLINRDALAAVAGPAGKAAAAI